MHDDAIEHLKKADKVLGRLIRKVGPCDLQARERCSPFQALVQSVAHQQLNGTAANTILKRVMALYPGRPFPTPDDVLATPDDKLRGAGLSRAKVAAIKDIAAKTVEGVVPASRVIAKMPDAEILERLTSIRGVGPWTVEMLLMFTLGREDVFAVDDYGIQVAMKKLYNLDDSNKKQFKEALLKRSQKWKPYRTYACMHLWRWKDAPKETA